MQKFDPRQNDNDYNGDDDDEIITMMSMIIKWQWWCDCDDDDSGGDVVAADEIFMHINTSCLRKDVYFAIRSSASPQHLWKWQIKQHMMLAFGSSDGVEKNLHYTLLWKQRLQNCHRQRWPQCPSKPASLRGMSFGSAFGFFGMAHVTWAAPAS